VRRPRRAQGRGDPGSRSCTHWPSRSRITRPLSTARRRRSGAVSCTRSRRATSTLRPSAPSKRTARLTAASGRSSANDTSTSRSESGGTQSLPQLRQPPPMADRVPALVLANTSPPRAQTQPFFHALPRAEARPLHAAARRGTAHRLATVVTGATTADRSGAPSRLPKKTDSLSSWTRSALGTRASVRPTLGLVRQNHPKPRLSLPGHVDRLRTTSAHRTAWPP
jgi:hypothetical protein